MRRMSFLKWLEHRVEEIPDATELAIVIARSGAAGMSRDDLGAALQISPETLEDLLSALVASGQVAVVKVNGQLVYRATG